MRLRTSLPGLLCAFAPVLCAQSIPAAGSIEIGAYGQVTRVEPSQARFDTRTPLSLGLRGRMNLDRATGIEIEASTSSVEGVDQAGPRRYNQLVVRGTWSHPLSDFSTLLIGVGLARTDYEVTYNFGPSALVGIRTIVRGRTSLRSDAIYNYLPTSGATEFGLRTGMQVALGPFDGPTTRDRRAGRLAVGGPATVEVGGFVQQWRLNDIWNLSNGRAGGIRVGAFVTSRTTFEVDATYGRRRVARGNAPGSTGGILRAGETYRQTTFSMRAVQQLPVSRRIAVFAGVGPVRSSYEYVDHWGVSLLTGVRVALTPVLHVRAEGLVNYHPNASAADAGLRIGLSAVTRLGRE